MVHVCDRVGCNKKATHKIVLELKTTPNGGRAISTALVYVCGIHTDVEWSDVVTKDAWQKIVEGFAYKKMPLPIKEYCNVIALPIYEAPIKHPYSAFRVRGLH
jgi:hypothetical protein